MTIRDDLKLKVRDLQLQKEKADNFFLFNHSISGLERKRFCVLLLSLVRLAEAREKFAGGHAEKVRGLAVMLGQELGLSRHRLERLETAAIMHDIGKIGIPADVLNKPGRLTTEEFELVKSHPCTGVKILANFSWLKDVLEIVRQHHEKFNGRGYPRGLEGEDILFEARILTVADIFAALCADRPYRNKMPLEQAMAVLEEEARVGFLDRQVVNAFLAIVRRGENTF